MGNTVHLCNAFLEWEVAGRLAGSLGSALTGHKAFRKLQYLACLYGAAEDLVVVTEWEKQNWPFPTPKMRMLSQAISGTLDSWAPSLLVKKWAEKKGLLYDIPDWELIKKVSSKKFSFERSPLPGAKLLLEEGKIEGNLVYKSLHETAGRGHYFKPPPKEAYPVIAEPWVEKVLDFSSQWILSKEGEIELIGITSCETDHRGRHLGNTFPTTVPDEGAEHIEKVLPILKEVASRGFFGHLGIDAFYYLSKCKTVLHPCVEINPRKTMGWATIAVQKRHFPNEKITLRYNPKVGFTLTTADGKKIGNE